MDNKNFVSGNDYSYALISKNKTIKLVFVILLCVFIVAVLANIIGIIGNISVIKDDLLAKHGDELDKALLTATVKEKAGTTILILSILGGLSLVVVGLFIFLTIKQDLKIKKLASDILD